MFKQRNFAVGITFKKTEVIQTALVGLMLMNFPGKYRLERWLVTRPGAMPALNWLRERRGQPPFELPRGQ